MEQHKVVLIKGDGIGPEISASVQAIFAAAKAPVEWIEREAGLGCIERYPSGLPEDTVQTIQRIGVALKGPTTTPTGGGHKSVNVTLRKALDLYANVRPSRTMAGVATRYDHVDLIIVRENIEDTYAGIEHMQSPDVAQSLKIITRPGSLKVCRYAFELARTIGRKKVVAFHKANIHKLTDGLFLQCFQEVARDYPDIESGDILVDNLCMQLVSRPEQFDVLVGANLYGDIVSDLCAGLVGGLGVAPGGNIGDTCAIFEAVHGSAPDIAGKGLANPTALLMSAIMMLDHLGHVHIGEAIQKALDRTFDDGIKTKDLGGSSSTQEFTEAIIERLEPPILPDPASALPITIQVQHEDLNRHASVEYVGVDVFVHYDGGIPNIPKEVDSLSLHLISNRGTKIYPGPLPFAMLVNWYRCRYLSFDAQGNKRSIRHDEVLHLLHVLDDLKFDVVHMEKLARYDGVDAFSKAQGE